MRILRLILFIIAILFGACCLPFSGAYADLINKKILVLQSYDSELPWVKSTTLGIRDAVKQETRVNFLLNFEFLDLSREHKTSYRNRLKELLVLKYAHDRPDLVVCMDSLAAIFVLDFRSEIFFDVPMVFSMARETYNQLNSALPAGCAVVVHEVDHAGSLALALKLFPDTRNVYMIAGQTRAGRFSEGKLQQVSRQYEDRIEFHSLSDLAFDRVLQRVEGLPENSIIFQLIFFTDINGNTYIPVNVTKAVSQHANSPIFSLYEPHIGHGAFGGKMITATSIGRNVVRLGAGLLENPRKTAGKILSTSSAPMFDWQQLQRWKINESRLPKDSIVRFKKYSFWEMHRSKVLLVAGIVLFQAVLIFFLIISLVQRKKTESFLLESRENLKESSEDLLLRDFVMDNASIGVFWFDSKGAIFYANQRAAFLLGYSQAQLLGKHIWDIDTIITRQMYAEQWQQMGDGQPIYWESMQIRKDGSRFPVEVHSRQIMHKNKRLVCGFVLDISKRKAAEERFEKIQAAFHQSQKMEAIGTLAGGIAHDFNNILGAIIGYAELVRMRDAANVSTVQAMDQILLAGKRAKELVMQILLFSRKSQKENIPLKIESLVKEVIKLLRATLPANIEIQTSFSAPSGVVMADPAQIHQILMNLCTNAFHAMQEDSGLLCIGLEEVCLDDGAIPLLPDLEPGPYICLKVSDTGSGIPADIMDQIFDPFFTTKTESKGTGLGLAVVHGIVKSHNGAVKVYSEPGKGTTFNVFLPSVNRDDDTIPEVPEHDLLLGRETILFVDDETALVDIGQDMLGHLGYKVVGFSESLEAWRAFEENPGRFDIVITDKNMPHLTGLELAEKIRHIRPAIPIIMCTGFQDPSSMDRAGACGINSIISKPLLVNELAVTIRKVLKEFGNQG